VRAIAGYSCWSEFEMTQPGTYQFFLQTEGQSSMVGVGHCPRSDCSWGESVHQLTHWCSGGMLVMLEFQLSDTEARLTVQPARNIDGLLLPTEKELVCHTLALQQPTYPWVVVSGTMHNARLRAMFHELREWQPSQHSKAPHAFRELVHVLFQLRNDDTTVLSALPRELMYLLVDAMWWNYVHDISHATTGSDKTHTQADDND